MKHIEWLDGIKGAAITLIVGGHVVATLCNLTTGETQGMLLGVFDVVYSFHVPLFFVIAGLTFSTNRRFCEFAWLKFLRLMVPYYIWGVIGALLVTFMGQAFTIGIHDGSNTLHFAGKVGGQGLLAILAVIHAGGWPDGKGFWFNGVLWFLPVMFVVELSYYWIAKICKDCASKVFFSFALLWLFLLYWSPFVYQLASVKGIYLPFNLAWVPKYLPFIALGHWGSLRFIRNEPDNGPWTVCGGLLSTSVLVYVAIVCCCPWLGVWRWDIPNVNLSIYYVKWLLKAIPGVAFMIFFARINALRGFSFLAPMSIGIMLFHKYPLVLCQMAIGRLGGIAHCGIASVCGIALTLTALLTLACYAWSRLVARLAPWSLGVRKQ